MVIGYIYKYCSEHCKRRASATGTTDRSHGRGTSNLRNYFPDRRPSRAVDFRERQFPSCAHFDSKVETSIIFVMKLQFIN